MAYVAITLVISSILNILLFYGAWLATLMLHFQIMTLLFNRAVHCSRFLTQMIYPFLPRSSSQTSSEASLPNVLQRYFPRQKEW